MVQTYDLKLTCPDLKTQVDETIIHQTLTAAPGIGLVEVDHRTHRVHVTTANQDGGTDVVRRLTDAGYPPADV